MCQARLRAEVRGIHIFKGNWSEDEDDRQASASDAVPSNDYRPAVAFCSAKRQPVLNQRPVKLGMRFSSRAATPSRWSSVTSEAMASTFARSIASFIDCSIAK